MKKLLLALPALVIAMAAVFASTGQSVNAAAVSLKVRAGDGETGYTVNLFLPEDIYLRAGDTVTWEFAWDEPHSVTFGEIAGDPSGPSNPGTAVVDYDGTGFVNSGLVFGSKAAPQSFSMKFTKEGNFDYYCFIHPLMTGTVRVQGAGIGEQDTQVAVDARGQAAYESAIADLKAAAAATAAVRPLAVTGSSAAKKYTLQISSLTDRPRGDVMQFFPASLNIGANDTVEFVSNVQTPHDVAFIPAGVDLNGPPPPGLEDFDPFEDSVNYSPGKKLSPSDLSISPVVGLELPAGTSVSFAFSAPGTYNYVCLLHVAQGMAGRINVTAGAPLPPNTGNALTPAENSGTSGLWLVFGAVGIAFAATGVAFATTRR